MNELSLGQQEYLQQHRKHQRIVRISRILILFSFLFLWEFTANVSGEWFWTAVSSFIPVSRCMRRS